MYTYVYNKIITRTVGMLFKLSGYKGSMSSMFSNTNW